MAGSQPFNIFIILDLDPANGTDKATCLAQLGKLRGEWSKQKTNPIVKVSGEAARKLELYEDIKAAIDDDVRRAKDAQEAAVEIAQKTHEQFKPFDAMLQRSALKGYVTTEEISEWVNTYAGKLTEAEIHARITAAQVTIKRASAPQPQPQLDPTLAKSIRTLLDALHQTDLYALLKSHLDETGRREREIGSVTSPFVPSTLGPGSNRDGLKKAADKLSSDMRLQVNKTPVVNNKSTLAGLAAIVFGSDDKKRQYDETLRREPLEKLRAQWIPVCDPTKKMTDKQSDQFLEEARKLGLSTDEAEAELISLAAERRWVVTLTARDDRHRQQVACDICHELNDPNRNYCTRCGHELFYDCPNCDLPAGRHMLASVAACGGCGFAVGNRYLIRELLDEAAKLNPADNGPRLKAKLDEINKLWPLRRVVGKTEPLSERIDALTKQYTSWLLTAANNLLGANDLLGAAAGLANARALWPPLPNMADDLTRQMQALETTLASRREEMRIAQAAEREKMRIAQEAKDKADAERLKSEQEARDKAQQAVEQARNKLAQARNEFDQAVKKKRFFAARDLRKNIEEALENKALGDDLRNATHDALSKVGGLIDDTIAQVGRDLRYEETASPRHTDDQIAKVCVAALERCADFLAAKGTLANLSVTSPSDLQVIPPSDTTVTLEWALSPSPGDIHYCVVRSLEGAPRSPQDGATVVDNLEPQVPTNPHAKVPVTYTDEHPEIGAPLYYAAFAVRGARASDPATVTHEPLTRPVQNVTTETGDECVELTWELPERAIGAKVLRKEAAAPEDLTDGAEYPHGATSMRDTRVTNGIRYGYAIFAQFPDYERRPVYAKPVIAWATPQKPPPPPTPVTGLVVEMEEYGFAYAVTNIPIPSASDGEVVILRRTTPPGAHLHMGSVVSQNDLENIGIQLTTGERDGRSVAIDSWDVPGQRWYIPVTRYEGQRAMIGETRHFTAAFDVQHLVAHVDGRNIALRWQWPAQQWHTQMCDEALVLSDPLKWPSGENNASSTWMMQPVQREPGNPTGVTSLPATGRERLIVVRATATYNGQTFLSAGQRVRVFPEGKRPQLTYEFKPQNGGAARDHQEFTVKLRIRGTNALPSFSLIQRIGQPPEDEHDGQLVLFDAGFVPARDGVYERTFAITPQRDLYMRLFLHDPAERDLFLIEHPNANRLKLS